jgi:hypothetical protein
MLLPSTKRGDGSFAAEFAGGGDHLPGALAYLSVGVLDEMRIMRSPLLRCGEDRRGCGGADRLAIENFC